MLKCSQVSQLSTPSPRSPITGWTAGRVPYFWIRGDNISKRLNTHGSKTGTDFRSRESAPTFGTCVMQKRLRFLTAKIDSDFRLRLERVVVFTYILLAAGHFFNVRRHLLCLCLCSISRSIFGSKWSIEIVVIDWSSLFSFGLFVNSAELVNIHFDYVFFFLLRLATTQNYKCIIAAATASSSSFSAMSVIGVENWRRFLRSKTGADFRLRK